MLTSAHRLTDADSFRRTARSGRRSGSRTLVVHLDPGARPGPSRVGFVVSKAVGNAVVRNRVKRRLRHLARSHITSVPGSSTVVVRALPASASASYQELALDLERCFDRMLS